MKKINNNVLRDYYESYSFVIPKHLQNVKIFTNTKINNWSLLDSYIYTKNLKQILNLLNQLINNNIKKNKILFILDDDIYFFFEKTFKQHHFLSNDLKGGLEFLQTSKYASSVVSIIYIGKNNDFSPKIVNQLQIPLICFSTKTKFHSDYFNYNALTFHGSILYLKLLLKSILVPKL